jgi:tRNA dimethylallyltransferase
MTIGTAKPTEAELKKVPHHFINSKSITELYGSGHFADDAIKLIDHLFKKHDVLFMVGGSGLYIEAVLNGLDDLVTVPKELREHLNEKYRSEGLNWLQEEIRKKDPLFFEEADTNNPQRLIRALEVIEHTGKPFSEFRKGSITQRNFTPIKILVNAPREILYDRINRRVDKMMNDGLLAEVEGLIDFRESNALKTVGYKELYDFLDGKCDLQSAVEKIKQHTRNYAKRQITWFKNRDDFKMFEGSQKNEIIEYINQETKNG